MMLFNDGWGYGGGLSAPCRLALVALRVIKTHGLMIAPWLNGYFASYRLFLNGGSFERYEVRWSYRHTPPCNTGGFEKIPKSLPKWGFESLCELFMYVQCKYVFKICMCNPHTLE